MMSLEARVTTLEHKVEHLEHVFHENNKILEATHGVVSMILNEQQEMKKKMIQLDNKIDQIEARLNSKIDQVEERLESKFNARFDQLELLIRQCLPKN